MKQPITIQEAVDCFQNPTEANSHTIGQVIIAFKKTFQEGDKGNLEKLFDAMVGHFSQKGSGTKVAYQRFADLGFCVDFGYSPHNDFMPTISQREAYSDPKHWGKAMDFVVDFYIDKEICIHEVYKPTK